MARYKVYGTNEPYDGMTVTIGDFEFTTLGGALEGNSLQLVVDDTIPEEPEVDMSNDVVTTFVTGDGSIFGNGSYFYADGSLVPIDTELHHHTIIPAGRNSNFMTQHVMDGNDVDVFTIQPATDANDVTDAGVMYLEDYDIGTNDGVLNVTDVTYWNEINRGDIAQTIVGFIANQEFPPNRPTQQGGAADNTNTNQQQQNGGMNGNGGGMNGNSGNNPGGNVGGNNTGGNQGGGGGMY